jgi:acyl-CoA thioesterase FadM
MNEYSRTYQVRFSDIDANRHVNNAVYIDATADVRYQFFAENGFPPERFGALASSCSLQFEHVIKLNKSVRNRYYSAIY